MANDLKANDLKAYRIVAPIFAMMVFAAVWILLVDEPTATVVQPQAPVTANETNPTPLQPIVIPPQPGLPASRLDLDAMLHRDGVVTFRTNDGVFQGIDNDVDIELRGDGFAKVVVYGAGVQVMRGKYHVYIGGRVEFQLGKDGWPDMRLRRDARSLMLAHDERIMSALREPYRAIPAAEIAKWQRRFGTHGD